MRHEFTINCLVGDIINYYSKLRFAKYNKIEKDPNELVIDVYLNRVKGHTSNIIVTDGFINEFDSADLNPDTGEVYFRKKVKVCNATYAVYVNYTKVGATYTVINTNLYIDDISRIDEILREIPNDIYFW